MILLDRRKILINQANSGTIHFELFIDDETYEEIADLTVSFMVKKSKKDPDDKAFIKKSFVIEKAMLDPILQIDIDLTPQDTSIPVDFYYWSIMLTSGSSYKNEVVSGNFDIIEGVQD